MLYMFLVINIDIILFFVYVGNMLLKTLTIQQMVKMYQNERRSAFGNWAGIIKSPPLMYTDDDIASQMFFQFDTSYASKDKNKPGVKRIIGWGHPIMMDMLKETRRNIFIDCTFQCVPQGFEQLLILMVYSKPRKYYFPCFYVLMQEKTQFAYEVVFKHIHTALEMKKIDVATATCDFEKALVNALKKTYGKKRTRYILCFFHFKQAIRRKLRDSLHLPNDVIAVLVGGKTTTTNAQGEMESVRIDGLIDLLTVIPPNEIEVIGIPYIREVMKDIEKLYPEKFDEFWKYFVRVWLKTYEPTDWNIGTLRKEMETTSYSSDMEEDDPEDDDDEAEESIVNRTNNALECHNKFVNNSFPCSHPSVVDFVATLRLMAQKQVQKFKSMMNGTYHPKKHAPLTRCTIPSDYENFRQELLQNDTEIAQRMHSCDYIAKETSPSSPTQTSGSDNEMVVEEEARSISTTSKKQTKRKRKERVAAQTKSKKKKVEKMSGIKSMRTVDTGKNKRPQRLRKMTMKARANK